VLDSASRGVKCFYNGREVAGIFVARQMLCIVLRLAEPVVSSSLGGVNIRSVLYSRDLDVTITSDLSLLAHTHDIVVKANQRSNAIRCCFLSRNVCLLIHVFSLCPSAC